VKKRSFLILALLIAFGPNQLNASSDLSSDNISYTYLAKAIGQFSGFVYLSKKLVNLDDNKDISRSCRYQHGFEKWWFLLGGGLLAASTTENWGENMKRVTLLAGLVGATHAIANNNGIVKSTRRMPVAGFVFTDPEDCDGFEQASMGTVTRYACTYMGLRTLIQWLTKNTDYDVSGLLI